MGNTKVYLDNCCYNRPYDDQSQIKISLETQAKLYVQHLIVEKKLDLVYSYISRYENSQNPFEIRRSAIKDFFKNATIYVDETYSNQAIIKAKNIIDTGVKTKDALHVACAIIGGAEYFLSTDIRLLKYNTNEIKLVNPIEFVSNLEV